MVVNSYIIAYQNNTKYWPVVPVLWSPNPAQLQSDQQILFWEIHRRKYFKSHPDLTQSLSVAIALMKSSVWLSGAIYSTLFWFFLLSVTKSCPNVTTTILKLTAHQGSSSHPDLYLLVAITVTEQLEKVNILSPSEEPHYKTCAGMQWSLQRESWRKSL